MNAITPSIVTSRRSLTVEIGEATVEFSPEETRISLGKSAVALPRQTWLQAVAESPVYDNALGGVLASAPLSVPAAPRIVTAYELGAELGGGLCAGRHPTEEGRIRKMALSIIDQTDIGVCTVESLIKAGFTAQEIERAGTKACEMASKMTLIEAYHIHHDEIADE